MFRRLVSWCYGPPPEGDDPGRLNADEVVLEEDEAEIMTSSEEEEEGEFCDFDDLEELDPPEQRASFWSKCWGNFRSVKFDKVMRTIIGISGAIGSVIAPCVMFPLTLVSYVVLEKAGAISAASLWGNGLGLAVGAGIGACVLCCGGTLLLCGVHKLTRFCCFRVCSPDDLEGVNIANIVERLEERVSLIGNEGTELGGDQLHLDSPAPISQSRVAARNTFMASYASCSGVGIVISLVAGALYGVLVFGSSGAIGPVGPVASALLKGIFAAGIVCGGSQVITLGCAGLASAVACCCTTAAERREVVLPVARPVAAMPAVITNGGLEVLVADFGAEDDILERGVSEDSEELASSSSEPGI